MREPLEKYMRVGIVHQMAFPELGAGRGPWEETVREIALDPFFDAIEIIHIEDPLGRQRVGDLLRLGRLSVGFAAHPAILGQGLDISGLDDVQRNQACAFLEGWLLEARDLGAESFLVLSGKDPGPEKRPRAVDALVASLERLCAFSSRHAGPRVVAEVFDCDVDKCCLLGPAALAREVAQEVSRGHDNFGLLVDMGHIPLLQETPEQALLPIREHLAGVHLGNAVTDPAYPGYGDNHPIFGVPGSANDVPELIAFLRALMEIGFLDGRSRPMVSFEIKPMAGQDSRVMIAHAKRALRAAWAQL